jgi:AcrR family transcriptional regulator
MARPVDADATRTRHRILTSACDSFAARGATGSSMRTIARGAGVSVAMVHHYFGSKDELYDSCIDAMYEELVPLSERLEGALGAATDPKDVIRAAVREGFRFGRAHQTAVRLLMRQVIETGSLDPGRRARAQAPFLDTASRLLSAALVRIDGPPSSPPSMRLAVQSVVMLVARYASSSLDELRFFAGSSDSDEQILGAIESHLTTAAQAILQAS